MKRDSDASNLRGYAQSSPSNRREPAYTSVHDEHVRVAVENCPTGYACRGVVSAAHAGPAEGRSQCQAEAARLQILARSGSRVEGE